MTSTLRNSSAPSVYKLSNIELANAVHHLPIEDCYPISYIPLSADTSEHWLFQLEKILADGTSKETRSLTKPTSSSVSKLNAKPYHGKCLFKCIGIIITYMCSSKALISLCICCVVLFFLLRGTNYV